MAEISITPREALADEVVVIKIGNLHPRQKVTVESRHWDGHLFHAFAHYTSSGDGAVDLDADESMGGDFVGVEPMGLFWAAKMPRHAFNRYSRFRKRDVTKPHVVIVSVYDGHLKVGDLWKAEPIAKESTRRWYIHPSVTRLPIREGKLRGVSFVPNSEGPHPAVIDLYGSGLGLMEQRPSLMARHGFVTFALAYHGYDDLPEFGAPVAMEYFEEAVKFLSEHEKVDQAGVGVVGTSMGGSMALAMAGRIPSIRCVVSVNAPAYMTEAALTHGKTTWRPFEWNRNHLSVENGILRKDDAMPYIEYNQFPEHMPGWQHSKATMLFISAGDDHQVRPDRMWPITEAVLKSANKTNFKRIHYPDAGHLIERPYTPMVNICYNSKTFFVPILQGGRAVGHARAQENSWREIIRFLKDNLGKTGAKL